MYNPYLQRPPGQPPPEQTQKRPPERPPGGLTAGLGGLFSGLSQNGDWLMVLILFFLYLECGDEDFLIMAAALLLPELQL